MNKALSLNNLKRIAIAKHGENRAWSLAMLNGNSNPISIHAITSRNAKA